MSELSITGGVSLRFSLITLARSTASLPLASSGHRLTAACCLKRTPSGLVSRRADQPNLMYPRNSNYYAAARLYRAVEGTQTRGTTTVWQTAHAHNALRVDIWA